MNVGGTAVAERAWCVVVPHHARGARVARQRLASELGPLAGNELLADAVAVIAELVGNAIRHAEPLPGEVIRVAWKICTRAGRQHLEVRVTDGGAGDEPQQRDVGPDSIDGRGLAIVSALAETWGVERDGLGQSVWARLSRPLSVTQLAETANRVPG
ncbi:MAG: ATP-binding protein [Actinobacteria bacterium]|nr:MAG: ATP-binding protein [Actinomycetota bacterium]